MRRKKFWAPGHGDLHLSLESYMLCKDSYWHLVDSYNQKQPPFVMPLQVSQCAVPLYDSTLGVCLLHYMFPLNVMCQSYMHSIVDAWKLF